MTFYKFTHVERDILLRLWKTEMEKEESGKRNTAQKASYTIEAAVIMPVYVCLAVVIFLFFHVFTVSWGVEVAANEAARQTALFGEMSDNSLLALNLGLAEKRILEEKLPAKHIRGGVFGISFLPSEIDEKDIRLIAVYDMPLPVRMFQIRHFTAATNVRARRWVGYDPHEGEEGTGDVYVTEYGRVYHRSTSCSYLDLSIHAAAKAGVGSLRNASGAKYYDCPLCKSSGSYVYITDYGTSYHGSLSCSGLKRTIYQMKELQAQEKGYGACSKCGR